MLMYVPISGFTSKGILSGWHTIRIDIYCETAGSSDPLTGSLSGGAFEQSIDSLANGAKPCETALCSQSEMSSLLSENHIAVTVHSDLQTALVWKTTKLKLAIGLTFKRLSLATTSDVISSTV